MIHAATAQPHTVSLIVRGPAVKKRFMVCDRSTGQAWWQYGATNECESEALTKRMTEARWFDCVQHLVHLTVI
jgi:hypothetical protein